MLQLWKRLRIFFKKLEFHAFHGSGWRFVRGWKVQSWGVHRDFHGSVRNSFASGTSSREKHLENFSKVFFQVFWWLVLATCMRFDSVAKIACFAQNGLVFEPFQFSFEFSWLFIVFPISNLSKTHHVTLKETPFLQISKEKVWVFYPQSIFHVFSLVFLILWDVVGVFELYGFRTWVYSIGLAKGVCCF